jgi:hypothetical protein
VSDVTVSPGKHWLKLAPGAPLSVVGFGVTIYGYFDLGFENT